MKYRTISTNAISDLGLPKMAKNVLTLVHKGSRQKNLNLSTCDFIYDSICVQNQIGCVNESRRE